MDTKKNHTNQWASMKPRPTPEWIKNLDQVLILAQSSEKISVRTLVELLSKKAVFAVLIVLSLPFCLPIQIPGLSTPFGLIIGFLSIRLIFKKHRHVPHWLLRSEISSKTLTKIVNSVKKFFVFCKKFTRRRLIFLVQGDWIHKLHGMFLFVCALILSLPLPIPFSNFLVATPILCISIGYLEEDGLFVMLGYFIISLGAFALMHAL
jgi:hypothetical protein